MAWKKWIAGFRAPGNKVTGAGGGWAGGRIMGDFPSIGDGGFILHPYQWRIAGQDQLIATRWDT